MMLQLGFLHGKQRVTYTYTYVYLLQLHNYAAQLVYMSSHEKILPTTA